MRPKWIVVEGADKVGKTTLSKRLHERLPDSVWTREPGTMRDDVCGAIRKVLHHPELHPDAELLLFGADRVQHEQVVVLPMLVLNSIRAE